MFYSTMSNKRNNSVLDISSEKKRKRKALSIEFKLNVVRRAESGQSNTEISKALDSPRTTIVSILKDKDRILAQGKRPINLQAKIIKNRFGLVPEVEKLLITWIEDQNQQNIPVNLAIIQSKALSLFDELKKDRGDAVKDETFNASRGWYNRFKTRANLHDFKIINKDIVDNHIFDNHFYEKPSELIQRDQYYLGIAENKKDKTVSKKRTLKKKLTKKDTARLSTDRLKFWTNINETKISNINMYKSQNLDEIINRVCPTLVSNLQDYTDTIDEIAESVVNICKNLNLDVLPQDVSDWLANRLEEVNKNAEVNHVNIKEEPPDQDLTKIEEVNIEEYNIHIKEEPPDLQNTNTWPHSEETSNKYVQIETNFDEKKSKMKKETCDQELTKEVICEAFQHLQAAMTLFEKHDPNLERRSRINQSISEITKCYRDIFGQRFSDICS